MRFKPVSAVYGAPLVDGYIAQLGLPVRWVDDVSGQLASAVWAYINHCAEPQQFPEPKGEQLEMLIAYLRYYVNAPCWEMQAVFADDLSKLRVFAEGVATVDDVRGLIRGMMDIAIDPL